MEKKQIVTNFTLSEREQVLRDMYVVLERRTPDHMHDILYLCQELGAVKPVFELVVNDYGGDERLKGYLDTHHRLARMREISDGYALFMNGEPSESIYIGEKTEMPENHEWIKEIGKMDSKQGYAIRRVLSDIKQVAKIKPSEATDLEAIAQTVARPLSQIEHAIGEYRRLEEYVAKS